MASDQGQKDSTILDTNNLNIVMPIFFNPEDPNSFWNEDEINLYAKLSTRSYPSYPYVDAAIMIIDNKILQWTAGRSMDEIIDFYCSDLFFELIKSIPSADFERFSKYIKDVDKGWIVKHLCTYLVEIFIETQFEDERKTLLFSRIKQIVNMIMGLWSTQYKMAFSINIAIFEILNDEFSLDLVKASELIEQAFNVKSRSMIKTLIQTAYSKKDKFVES
ncbi:MAG: hypothetical protein ACMG57_03520 [Candidatus Dojkabacteria bacterium]